MVGLDEVNLLDDPFQSISSEHAHYFTLQSYLYHAIIFLLYMKLYIASYIDTEDCPLFSMLCNRWGLRMPIGTMPKAFLLFVRHAFFYNIISMTTRDEA